MDLNNPSNIKIFALGGLNEVGKNMYCIEQNDELIIIDSGMGFSEEGFGAALVLPDYTYLKNNVNKIKGLFITHGHEDHIGGIPFLLNEVKIPKIYANAFAIKLIQSKLKDFSYPNYDLESLIEEYKDDSIYQFSAFTISFFRTNHSIPDSFGIAIKTRLGYILHTGDFKFDLTPLSNEFDYYKIAQYSKEGVLLLLSDSTNSLVNKPSISEMKVSSSLKSQFSFIKGRIIIATFASNTVRISQIIEAANSCNRKIIVFGKSIEKSIQVATSLKYLNPPKGIFMNVDEFPHLPDDKIVILSTGTQGEPLSSLSRIANGTHKNIRLKKGDTVIFSSSAIPGNQEKIDHIVDKLYSYGADVITNSVLSDVHSSGHANSNELQLMLNLCKPKYFMPIHGEYAMLYRHTELACEVGINNRNCFILNNGQVLTLNEEGFNYKQRVPSGAIYVDEKNNILDNKTRKERLYLSNNGIVFLTLAIENKKLISIPSIASRGFLYNKTSHDLIEKILIFTTNITNSYIKENDLGNCKEYVENNVSNYILNLTGRKPFVNVIILKK